MDFVVRSIIKMSMTFRNLAFSQAQRVDIPKFYNKLHYQKDKVNQCDIKSSKEDLIFKISQELNPSKLLNYIDLNKHQIKHEHIIVLLSSLHNFYQERPKFIANLHEEIDFTKLCICLKPQIKQLCPIESIEVLKILQLLNVTTSNIFIITLLQHLQEHINELSLKDIHTLSVLLVKFVPTNLSKSINSSIKNQFLLNISQIDKDDILSLIYALCFAFYNIKDETIINFLFYNVQNYNKKIELSDALNILRTLCDIKNLPHKFTSLIEQVQNIIIYNINELTSNQILYIVKGISSKISANHEEFYNENFIDKIVEKVIYENWNFLQGSNMLSCLNTIRHVQIDLLNYLSAKCYEDPNILNLESDLLQPLITGLALADYKPVFWDFMKEPILSNEISKIEDLKLCYFTLYLACLECFEPILLQKIFNTRDIISEEYQHVILKLYQIVKILCPSYNGPWPSRELLDFFKYLQKNKNKDYPLLAALERALGGNVYIKTNIQTTLKHYIDHVVIINRDGYPIDINSFETIETKNNKNIVTYLEDLSIPPGSQIFLILYAKPEWYARNTQRMLGPYSLFIKTLELMSYTVIPINQQMWQKMPSHEQTLYIMQAIKLKFEDNSISTTS